MNDCLSDSLEQDAFVTTLLQTQSEVLSRQELTEKLATTITKSFLGTSWLGILIGVMLICFVIGVCIMYSSRSSGQGLKQDEDDKAEALKKQKSMQEIKETLGSPMSAETLIAPISNRHSPTSLTFKDVALKVANPDGSERTILEPCSGHFHPDELVAVMGPSGSGKSTLVDILANKKTSPYEGEVKINGQPRDELFQRIASYVGQEDVMPEFWTVKEAIAFNMELKGWTPENVTASDAPDTSVETLLVAFGLENVQDTFIGGPKVRGISGGERRRVTLARGLAARANILFCDEPTSGLSATDAERCVQALRLVAKKCGVLTLIVIHQPRVEVAELFDRVVMLTSQPGRMVYNGPMKSAGNYWMAAGHSVPESTNPTDFFIDTITPQGPQDYADELAERFRKEQKPGIEEEVARELLKKGSTATEILFYEAEQMAKSLKLVEVATPRLSKYATPLATQTSAVFRRKVALLKRDRSGLMGTLGAPVVTRCFIGLMFGGIGLVPFEDFQVFFFNGCVAVMVGCMQMVSVNIDARSILKHDAWEALYGEEAFILGHLYIDSALSFIGVMIGSCIAYACSLLPWRFFPVFISWISLAFLNFDALFGMVTAFAATAGNAQAAAVIMNPLTLTFSGFMQSKLTAPFYFQWVFYISPVAYAIEGIATSLAPYYEGGWQWCAEKGLSKEDSIRGVIVMLVLPITWQFLRVLSLKHRNHLQK